MDMKEIYIATWNGSLNYGTNLQAYALNKYLKKNGHICYMISKRKDITLKNVVLKMCDVIKRKFGKERTIASLKGIDEKKDKINKFVKNEFEYVKINSGKRIDYNVESTVFITGSDQIWNPYHLDKVMLLDYVPERYKRISYASSVAVSKIPNKSKKLYIKNLRKFSNITVREDESVRAICDVLPELSGKVKVVLDPTFLLDKKEWIDFSGKAFFNKQAKLSEQAYVFSYFVGTDVNYNRQVKEVSRLTDGCIYSANPKENYDIDYGELVEDAGPYDFIWLISNSKCVCTDSFHAVALAINMNKEFIVFKRFKDSDIKSQNSRLYSLLKLFGLQNRIVNELSDIDRIINEKIDYKYVNSVLEAERRKSISVLNNMIER